jgi:hypothetical protein
MVKTFLRNGTAQHRPEHQAQGNGGSINADGFAAFPGMKGSSDNRHAHGHLHGYGEPLNDPENDQHPNTPRQPAKQGCAGKAGQTGEKNPFIAEDVPQSSVNQDSLESK